MRDKQGRHRGECQKCKESCFEYNVPGIYPLNAEPEIKEALLAGFCYICKCSEEEHVLYTFTHLEELAFAIMENLFRKYEIETVLHASVDDTTNMDMDRHDFTYGEISMLSFPKILQIANPKPGHIFYDLGCGAAKPAFYASLLYPFSKVIGIEFLPSVVEIANTLLTEYNSILSNQEEEYPIPRGNMEIREGNITTYDFYDADIIYLACTTFKTSTLKEISKNCKNLKPGTIVITLTKPLPCLGEEEGGEALFDIFHKELFLMTWGLELVIFQTKC